jgi:hypothetical protein
MSGAVSTRSVYVRKQASAALPTHCRVIEVSLLLHALLLEAVDLPAEYALDGRDGRVMALLLDEIAAMPALPLNTPLPRDPRLAASVPRIDGGAGAGNRHRHDGAQDRHEPAQLHPVVSRADRHELQRVAPAGLSAGRADEAGRRRIDHPGGDRAGLQQRQRVHRGVPSGARCRTQSLPGIRERIARTVAERLSVAATLIRVGLVTGVVKVDCGKLDCPGICPSQSLHGYCGLPCLAGATSERTSCLPDGSWICTYEQPHHPRQLADRRHRAGGQRRRARTGNAATDLGDSRLYIHRELSQLQFNIRVLDQALDERTPLLERLKFLLIFSRNMDEFFEIRVAGLKGQIALDHELIGPTASRRAARWRRSARSRTSRSSGSTRSSTNASCPSWPRKASASCAAQQWTHKQKLWVRRYFRDEVAPLITPIGLDPRIRFRCWSTRASTSSCGWKAWMRSAAIPAWPSCRRRACCRG